MGTFAEEKNRSVMGMPRTGEKSNDYKRVPEFGWRVNPEIVTINSIPYRPDRVVVRVADIGGDHGTP
jgi:hypothetical protein